MPNQLTFEVYFKKEDIQELLKLDIEQIQVSGKLTVNADDSSSVTIQAKGFGGNFVDAPVKDGCPKPC